MDQLCTTDTDVLSSIHPAFDADSTYHYNESTPVDLTSVTPDTITSSTNLKDRGHTRLWRCTTPDGDVFIHEQVDMVNGEKKGAFFDDVEITHPTLERRVSGRNIATLLGLPTLEFAHSGGVFISAKGPETLFDEKITPHSLDTVSRTDFEEFITNGLDTFLTDLAKQVVMNDFDMNAANILMTPDLEYAFIDIRMLQDEYGYFHSIFHVNSHTERLRLPPAIVHLVMRRANELATAIHNADIQTDNTYITKLTNTIKQNRWILSTDANTDTIPVSEPNNRILTADPWTDVTNLLDLETYFEQFQH